MSSIKHANAIKEGCSYKATMLGKTSHLSLKAALLKTLKTLLLLLLLVVVLLSLLLLVVLLLLLLLLLCCT